MQIEERKRNIRCAGAFRQAPGSGPTSQSLELLVTEQPKS